MRDAISAANTDTAMNGCAAGSGADTITFSVGGTIVLGGGTLFIVSGSSITIDGTGQSVTVNGNSNTLQGVMLVNPGATLDLKNLTVVNGISFRGAGGIYNEGGTLSVSNSTFSGNSALDYGGGIVNAGSLHRQQQHLLRQQREEWRRHL